MKFGLGFLIACFAFGFVVSRFAASSGVYTPAPRQPHNGWTAADEQRYSDGAHCTAGDAICTCDLDTLEDHMGAGEYFGRTGRGDPALRWRIVQDTAVQCPPHQAVSDAEAHRIADLTQAP